MYPNIQFCVIISIDEMNITIRFHIYRPADGIWISEDLESFDEPII
ncbi:MAG: hypothetical protein ACPKOI_08205 [Pleomorphochaeta sp.]